MNNGLPEPTSTPPMPQLDPAFGITLNALQDVANERGRQIKDERFTREHDDTHKNGELAMAAACYTIGAYYGWDPAPDADGDVYQPGIFEVTWPWDAARPKDKRRDLVRAAALIVAEIERLDRLAKVPA